MDLNDQQNHWDRTFVKSEELFGAEASEPAKMAADLFRRESTKGILELGGGQGRDTLFFAGAGFHVHVLDYARNAVLTIGEKAARIGLSARVRTGQHDVRNPLPFGDGIFDACFSHMLYCMALTTAELESLSREIRRVLRPGGLNIYTVRHTGDPHYGMGIHRGEDMYEMAGFIVHFFSRKKVMDLSDGYDVIDIRQFEEGNLPRKLFSVTLRKQ